MASLLPVSGGARAADPAPESQEALGSLSLVDLLSTNVTTASRSDESIKVAPSNVTVVTQEQIRAWGAKDLKDVMRHVPGYIVLYDRDEMVLSARGNVSDNDQKYLILIDGHRMNSYENFGPGQIIDLPVDLSNVKHVEIVRGPGSAVWGSEALAGVINIITINGEDMRDRTVQASATFGQDHTYRGNFQVGREIAEDVSVVLHGAFAASDGRQIETDASTGFSKPYWRHAYCGYTPCAATDPAANKSHPLGRYTTDLERRAPSYLLHFKAHAKEFDVNAFALKSVMKNRQFESNDLGVNSAGMPQERNTYYSNDRYFVMGGWRRKIGTFEVSAQLSGDLWDMQYQNRQGPATFISWKEQRISAGASVNGDVFDGLLSINGGADYAYSTFGPSLRFDSVDPTVVATNTPGDNDGLITLPKKDRAAGAYGLVTAHLVNRRLHLTAGGRGDYNADRGDEDFSVSPRVAAVFETTEESSVKLIYNTGFLRPANFQRSGLPVKPEKMRQVEAIGMAKIGPITATVTGFWQKLSGVLLIRQSTTGSLTTGYANVGDYSSYGAELELDARFTDQISAWGNVSLARPRGDNFVSGVDPNSIRIRPDSNTTEEGRLLNYPTATFNLGVIGHIMEKILVAPTLRFVGPMPYRTVPPTATAPAVATVADAKYEKSDPLVFVDATLGYEPVKEVGFFLSGENLLDEQSEEPISVWNGTREQYGRYVEFTVRGGF